VAADLDLGAARAAYAADGCWLAPILFDADEVARFLAATERVLAGTYEGGRAPTLSLPFDPGPHDLRKVDNAWWADSDLAALATDPRLGELASALLGAGTVRLWQDQLLVKPPGGPDAGVGTIGWHQDWASWNTVASEGAFTTAWVAFDDVDDDNGAMQVLPGSHRWGLLPDAGGFFNPDRDGQLADLAGHPGHGPVAPRSLCMAAGQVSFHHPLTFHGSGTNTSDRMRRSLAIHLVDAEVTAVSLPGLWQHYHLALFEERGGRLGEPYRFDDLCPQVHPAP
jgi:ectoine hydroxylase-related dioxygenase (phytanoyl-CoA dioxygenase family)